jgi:hypothetical protein
MQELMGVIWVLVFLFLDLFPPGGEEFFVQHFLFFQ